MGAADLQAVTDPHKPNYLARAYHTETWAKAATEGIQLRTFTFSMTASERLSPSARSKMEMQNREKKKKKKSYVPITMHSAYKHSEWSPSHRLTVWKKKKKKKTCIYLQNMTNASP